MKENIEEDIECIQEFLEYSQDMINDMDYERPVDVTIYQNQINSLEHILFDYKRVLKENEELKAENNKLKVIKYDTNYGTETTNLIPKSELVKINTNRCMIEIENGKFVDLKQVYQENEELKEKWDKDTHKLQNDLDIANAEKIELQKEKEKLNKYTIHLTDEQYRKVIELAQNDIKQQEKQKIKDKIEFIEKEGYWLFLTDRDSDKCVEILKDLLEEKGE